MYRLQSWRLCLNSELYERKLHFWKLSLLFFKTHNACANQPCSNRCCEDNPCSNGGTCTEVCHHAKQKFNCTCAKGFFWKVVWKEKSNILQAATTRSKEDKKFYCIHLVYDPASKSFYETSCDLTSKTGFVWTLLESFSLANKNGFKAQPFLQDYPVSQNSFKWNKFRLSLPIMNSTLRHSTHFRATCNFNTEGLATTDYLRAKTTDLNILQLNSWPCVKMEYINIRGYDCYNCMALLIQGINWHLHTDSSYKVKACQFTSARDSSVTAEDKFGYYNAINTLHRCTSGNDSTTPWWFGEQ